MYHVKSKNGELLKSFTGVVKTFYTEGDAQNYINKSCNNDCYIVDKNFKKIKKEKQEKTTTYIEYGPIIENVLDIHPEL